MGISAGEPYRFGPFQLDLPAGWQAEFEDGIHEILPEDAPFAIHISGYSKEGPVETADLAAFAEAEGAEGMPITLASGFDGLTFDLTEPEQTIRYWLIRHGSAMLAITLTAAPEDFAPSAIPAQMVVSSLRPNEEP